MPPGMLQCKQIVLCPRGFITALFLRRTVDGCEILRQLEDWQNPIKFPKDLQCLKESQ